jgi:hypothetical protein
MYFNILTRTILLGSHKLSKPIEKHIIVDNFALTM